MKSESVRLVVRLTKSPAISEYYGDIFRTRNYGAERAAEIYPILREEALTSLKGVFSFEEIELLMKIMEFAIDRYELSKEIFIQKIQEIVKFRTSLKLVEKKMVKDIIEKIERMNFYQAVVLSEWLCSYHSFTETYKGQKKRKMNFRKYAEKII